MYFSYLNLPHVPTDFFPECLEKTKLIGVDPRINDLNKHRGPMNKATILPSSVNNWLSTNISGKIFNKNKIYALLNVTIYQNFWKRETWGTHPKHVDVGRDWAMNYYFTTGGDNTKIMWYADKEIVAETDPIIAGKWCLLRVNIPHSVKNIEHAQTRYFISVDIDNNNISDLEQFIDRDTII